MLALASLASRGALPPFVLALASRASRGALPPLVLALISRASRGALPPLVLALIGRPVRARRTSYANMEISCGCPNNSNFYRIQKKS